MSLPIKLTCVVPAFDPPGRYSDFSHPAGYKLTNLSLPVGIMQGDAPETMARALESDGWTRGAVNFSLMTAEGAVLYCGPVGRPLPEEPRAA